MSAETIPDDIALAAQAALDRMPDRRADMETGEFWARVEYEVVSAIHEAVMAERERCWAIANAAYRANATGSGFDSQPARATAYEIREAIRPAAPKAEG